jgi:hypothetical protein
VIFPNHYCFFHLSFILLQSRTRDALEEHIQTLTETLAPFQKLFGEKFTILTEEGRQEVNLQ